MRTTLPLYAALIVVAAPSYANLGKANGISGEVSINTGYVSSESQFNTDGPANINSLDANAETDSNVIFAPLGNIEYTFGSASQQQVYAGTSRADVAIGTLALQLGYKYQLPSRMVIDIAYLPTVMSGKTWANPYDLNTERQETDEKGNAFRLKLSNIAGSLFSLDLAYADKEIDDDQLQGTELERDGNTYYAKGQVRLPLSRSTMLTPAFTYIKHDAEGEASSFDSYRGELSLFQSFGAHRLALTAGYTKTDYDAQHTIAFTGQTRSEDTIKLFAAYEYDHFMGWNNWSFISFAGYNQTDANINFYDESQYIVSVGMNYKF